MENSKHHCHHHRLVHMAFTLVKISLQAATLAAAVMGVRELEKIHHRIKKQEREEHKEKRHLL